MADFASCRAGCQQRSGKSGNWGLAGHGTSWVVLSYTEPPVNPCFKSTLLPSVPSTVMQFKIPLSNQSCQIKSSGRAGAAMASLTLLQSWFVCCCSNRQPSRSPEWQHKVLGFSQPQGGVAIPSTQPGWLQGESLANTATACCRALLREFALEKVWGTALRLKFTFKNLNCEFSLCLGWMLGKSFKIIDGSL